MMNKVCLSDAETGSITFVFDNDQCLQDFLVTKPKWMKEENHQKVLNKFSSGILIKTDLPPARPAFVPDPMPEQRKSANGIGYLED